MTDRVMPPGPGVILRSHTQPSLVALLTSKVALLQPSLERQVDRLADSCRSEDNELDGVRHLTRRAPILLNFDVAQLEVHDRRPTSRCLKSHIARQHDRGTILEHTELITCVVVCVGNRLLYRVQS